MSPLVSTASILQQWELPNPIEGLALRHSATSIKLVVAHGEYGTSQAPERSDILNIGGFSDAVFNVVSSFMEGDASRFVREVESVEL